MEYFRWVFIPALNHVVPVSALWAPGGSIGVEVARWPGGSPAWKGPWVPTGV